MRLSAARTSSTAHVTRKQVRVTFVRKEQSGDGGPGWSPSPPRSPSPRAASRTSLGKTGTNGRGLGKTHPSCGLSKTGGNHLAVKDTGTSRACSQGAQRRVSGHGWNEAGTPRAAPRGVESTLCETSFCSQSSHHLAKRSQREFKNVTGLSVYDSMTWS